MYNICEYCELYIPICVNLVGCTIMYILDARRVPVYALYRYVERHTTVFAA